MNCCCVLYFSLSFPRRAGEMNDSFEDKSGHRLVNFCILMDDESAATESKVCIGSFTSHSHTPPGRVLCISSKLNQQYARRR